MSCDLIIELYGGSALGERRVAGVPLWLWPVAAFAGAAGATAWRVRTDDPGVARVASRIGRLAGDDVDARIVRADIGRPFIGRSSALHALDPAAPAPDAQEPIERVEVVDEVSLEFARAVARGLGRAHPIVREAMRFVLVDRESIRGVVTDVDGCLTDGSLFRTSGGEVIRAYNTKDGIGNHALARAGIRVAWLSTASPDRSITDRAESLGVTTIDVGSGDKGPRLARLCRQMGLEPANVAYLGDDTTDIPAMELAGLSAVPADALPQVCARADVVLECRGGRGAFRELADLVLGVTAP